MMILRFARWPAEHAKVKVLKYIQYVEIWRIVEKYCPWLEVAFQVFQESKSLRHWRSLPPRSEKNGAWKLKTIELVDSICLPFQDNT